MIEVYNKLKELQTKRSFSNDEKKYIIEQSRKFSLEFSFKTNCNNCYYDAVILLSIKLKNEMAKTEIKKECKYKMNKGKDILWKGIRINEATITDKIAEKFIKEVGEKEAKKFLALK